VALVMGKSARQLVCWQVDYWILQR